MDVKVTLSGVEQAVIDGIVQEFKELFMAGKEEVLQAVARGEQKITEAIQAETIEINQNFAVQASAISELKSQLALVQAGEVSAEDLTPLVAAVEASYEKTQVMIQNMFNVVAASVEQAPPATITSTTTVEPAA